MKLDCETAKRELDASLAREQLLRDQLKKEQEIIAKWKESRNVVENMIKIQGMETFCEKSWKKNKEKLDLPEKQKSENGSTDNDHPLIVETSTDNEHPSMVKTPTDEPDPLINKKKVSNKDLEKLDKKYGSVAKNFVQGECSQTKQVEEKNIGHLSNKDLKVKLENVKVKAETKKKNNRNGKVGINKHNNYKADKFAPRKMCANCGSVNHLSINCKSVKIDNMKRSKPTVNMPMPPLFAKPEMFDQFAHFNPYVNMPFVPNPYMNMFNMPSIPWNVHSMNNLYASPSPHTYDSFTYEQMTTNRPTSKVKVDLDQSKPKMQKGKKKANQTGPKETWVPKTT